jgi:O-antigen/teichoic acid export membrane protein
MRLGQTSLIDFISRLSSSAVGFLATIYIARQLGAGPLGVYNVTIGLVSWAVIFGKVGLSEAISKRVSEGEDQSQYAVAGLAVILGFSLFFSAFLIIFRYRINEYVGESVAIYILLILFVTLLHSVISSLLTGLHLVHIDGITSTIKTTVRAAVQISLILAGVGTTALFIGHAAGFIFAILLGIYFVAKNLPGLSIPHRAHFDRLFDFAKFSWIGDLQSQMFNYTDIIILRLFVSASIIGVYAIAWNVAQFLILFSAALTSALFPEISSMSAKGNLKAVGRVVEQSLSFGGLFLIPGLFGGFLLGERILRIYGPEFQKGGTVLVILIFSNLLMGYQNQLLNTLNAIDRPDLAFRANAVFVGANLTLNVVLIYLYSWIGAAVATAASVSVSLVLAYYHVDAIIDFTVPTGEIAKQWVAALIMSGVVSVGLWTENTYRVLEHNAATVGVLVLLGAGVYFVVLLAISMEFRATVDRNVPVDLPLLSSG